jgi:hypothetical protein
MEKSKAALDVPKTESLMEVTEKKCTLRGLNPIMFDRYGGDNKTKLEPAQKMYYLEDGKTLCIPSTNVHSLLSAELTNSAPKMFEGKGWQNIAKACLSYLSITPTLIPITRDGKAIVFGRFDDGKDKLSGAFIHYSVAKMKKGSLVIPNPKVRPVLPPPWGIEFTVTLYRNEHVDEQKVLRLLKLGGLAIGLGTWRGVFGKFEVVKWE